MCVLHFGICVALTDLMFSDVAHQMYIVEIIEESLYMSRLIKDIVLYRLSAFITTFYSYDFALKGKGVKKKNVCLLEVRLFR